MLNEIDSLRQFALYPKEELVLNSKTCSFPKEQGNVVYLESVEGPLFRFGLLKTKSDDTEWVLGNQNISLSEFIPVYSYFTPQQLGIQSQVVAAKKGDLVYNMNKTYEVVEDFGSFSSSKEIKCVQITNGKKHVKRAEFWDNFSIEIKLFLSFLKKEFGSKDRVIIYSKLLSNYSVKSSRIFILDILIDDMFISNEDMVYYANLYGFKTPHVLYSSETFKSSIVNTYIGSFSKSTFVRHSMLPPVIKRILVKSGNACSIQDKKIFAFLNPLKSDSHLSQMSEISPLHIHI